jgi:hypothetical protein
MVLRARWHCHGNGGQRPQMVRSETFRATALGLAGAREMQILGSHEFRIKDRAFATLGWPEPGWAVVRLPIREQTRIVAMTSAASPEAGGRGRRGVTRLRLATLDEALLTPILQAAWRHVSAHVP